MSKKKREKVEAASELTTLNSNIVAESNESRQSDWFAKLKNHWWAVALIGLLSLGTFGAGLKYLDDSAKREKAANAGKSDLQKSPPTLLSKINPFVEAPLPSATPQLSKSYIYAGSRMLAVEDANAASAPPADLAVWRESTGFWYVLGGVQGSAQTAFQWGGIGDETAPGDYDGDGKTDFSVFRRANSTWYVSNSSNGTTTERVFGGTSDDKLAQADYDGDGRTDVAVYRAGTGYWYITKSSDQTSYAVLFGISGDVPTPADFDGDGKADLAVWRSSVTTFYYAKSSVPGAVQGIVFGASGDKPVVGDYDGDGKADATVWKGNGVNQWHTLLSATNTIYATSLGDPATDKAVQNDYDGDGKTDMAIWRPADGTWYIQQSSSGTRNVQWGQTGDVPVPAYYRR
jgi:hypothetical protein